MSNDIALLAQFNPNFSSTVMHWPCTASQKRSRSGLCSKPPDLRSAGDIALNPMLRRSKRE